MEQSEKKNAQSVTYPQDPRNRSCHRSTRRHGDPRRGNLPSSPRQRDNCAGSHPCPKSWTRTDPGAKSQCRFRLPQYGSPQSAPLFPSRVAWPPEPRAPPNSRAARRDARNRWPLSKIETSAWTCPGTRHRERHGAWRSNSRRRAKRRSGCRERCGEPWTGRGLCRDGGGGLRLGGRAGRGCAGNGDLLGKSWSGYPPTHTI